MAIYKLGSNSLTSTLVLDGLLTSNTAFNVISGNTISFNRVTGNVVTISANALTLSSNVVITTNSLVVTNITASGNITAANVTVSTDIVSSNITINTNLIVPVGPTGGRPSVPANGMIRFNTTTGTYEAYKGSWGAIGGAGATGGGSDELFYLNGTNVTASYSIPSGKNAMTAGPVTINDGVIVTVPDGSAWTIV